MKTLAKITLLTLMIVPALQFDGTDDLGIFDGTDDLGMKNEQVVDATGFTKLFR
jgi:hypothetical protein